MCDYRLESKWRTWHKEQESKWRTWHREQLMQWRTRWGWTQTTPTQLCQSTTAPLPAPAPPLPTPAASTRSTQATPPTISTSPPPTLGFDNTIYWSKHFLKNIFSPFSFSLFIISYYLTWRTVICMHACYLLFWECMYALCFCVLGVFFFFNFLCWLIECCNSSCYCNCTALWQSSCLAAIAQWALNEALLYQTILFIFFSFYVWLNLIITCVDNI